MAEAEIATAPNRRNIVWLTISAAAAAFVILFAGILPAEYNRDPLGLGKLAGTGKLWAPAEQIVTPVSRPGAPAAGAPASQSYPTPFRSDVVDVPLKGGGDPERGDEVEYKVHVKKGGSYVNSWDAPGIADPEEFYTEFHGHTLAKGAAMTVAYYRKATGSKDNGVLTAPFDGVHGWFFQNQSEKPVTVRLRIAGFYELIPDGQPGNEAGLKARPVR